MVTCVECGADMGTSKLCQQCGAPVVARPEDTPSTSTLASKVSSHFAPEAQPGGRDVFVGLSYTVVAVVDLALLAVAITLPVLYMTQGSPAQAGQSYFPLAAVLVDTPIFGIIPVLSVVFLIRWRIRRVRERAMASDEPTPLPETLD